MAAVAAALSAVVGISIIVHGMARNDLTSTLGGASLTTVALMLITLMAIRQWITDTHAERTHLAEATRRADDARTHYFVAQASIELERQRLFRDAAADRARTLATLDVERAQLQDAFDEQRAQLVCDTLEVGVKLMREHETAEAHERARVIAFPTQDAERARSRDVR